MQSQVLLNLKFQNISYGTIKKEIFKFLTNFSFLKYQFFIFYKKIKLTLLRAPFIHNKTKEQFEICLYFLNIFIKFHFDSRIQFFLQEHLCKHFHFFALVKVGFSYIHLKFA